MHDGTTLIVDVLTLGENSYALSLPAEDLWVAYEVVRRHVDANGVRHYSQMTEAKTTSDGYSFKFDTGDTFTCASHLDKPTSSTLSDEIGGGSGGGVLVVHDVDDTLDKTYKEIADAGFCVRDVLENDGLHVITPISSFAFEEGYGGMVRFGGDDYICSAENEYPSLNGK